MATTLTQEELAEFTELGDRRHVLGRALLVLVLLAFLVPGVHLSRRRGLQRALRSSHPRPRVVRTALRARDPGTVSLALRSLERLPARVVTDLLEGAPFGAGGPLDALAPPLLRRRGDRMARRCLRRIATGSPPG